MPAILPISAIMPTRNRAQHLQRTLESLAAQDSQPQEIIINDSSDGSFEAIAPVVSGLQSQIVRQKAQSRGAAVQRNEALALAGQPFILFMDDDILLESGCITNLWAALHSQEKLGGVNSMVTNQPFTPPGRLSRLVFRLLGSGSSSAAGRWLGGVLNLLPADSPLLPEVVTVEWLNTTCTLYRRAALPDPVFPSWFYGYSLGEDLALSLEVKHRGWRLANARTARIFHDSQTGDHKRSERELVAMEMANRWRIGRKYSGLSRARLAFNLALVQTHKLLGAFASLVGLRKLPAQIAGNIAGWWRILRGTGK